MSKLDFSFIGSCKSTLSKIEREEKCIFRLFSVKKTFFCVQLWSSRSELQYVWPKRRFNLILYYLLDGKTLEWIHFFLLLQFHWVVVCFFYCSSSPLIISPQNRRDKKNSNGFRQNCNNLHFPPFNVRTSNRKSPFQWAPIQSKSRLFTFLCNTTADCQTTSSHHVCM